MSDTQKVILALFLAGVLGSSSPVVNKILLRDLPPFTVSFLRFLIASLAISPMFLRQRKKSPPLTFSVLATPFLSSINILFFIIGVNKTSVNMTQTIYTGTPLVVAFLAWAFLGEKLTRYKLMGIMVGLVGVLTIIILPQFRSGEASTGNFLGNLLIFFAMLSWSSYTVGSRYLTNRKHYLPIYLISISFFLTALLFLMMMIVSGEISTVLTILTLGHFLLLTYLGVMATICNYFLYQWVNHHASAATASLTSYIGPPAGFLLAWIFLGEKLTWEIIMGTLIVFFGVYLASRTRPVKLPAGEGL